MFFKYKKDVFVLEYSESSDNILIVGKMLKFGYIEASYKKGAKRGWFECELSMLKEDFYKAFDIKEGLKNIAF